MHALANTTCIGKIATTKYLRRSSRLHEVGYPAPDTNLEFIPSPYLFVLPTLEGLPTKAEELPLPMKHGFSPLDANPEISRPRG